ncbi:alpha/beta hydrolase [Paenibacillus sp. N4]|uniref:alpha/beta hydrolase n=1 Tax=Paenibacillus vietnamensis TaxID=2590547 RepID=UPI001CD0BA80|nr:alpha/beta hydrolase [Paenibacillus vietnamensis]MCA0756272.1 alpha/beta hydrolase [Paenibacillus vietnamensis]
MMEAGTMLWLTGWSMPASAFDKLQVQLPEYGHIVCDYAKAESADEMIAYVLETARSVRALPEAAGGRRPLIAAGWSLGGLLALRLADEGLADGLLLLSGTAKFTRGREESGLGWPDGYVRQMAAQLGRDRQAVEEQFRKAVLTKEESEAGLGSQLPPGGGWSTESLLAGLQLLRREDYTGTLPGIRCPALLVHGTADTICPFGAAEEMAAGLPGAKLAAMPGCGHAPFLGREEEIAEKVRSWRNECGQKFY